MSKAAEKEIVAEKAPKKIAIKILSTDGDNSDVFLSFNGKPIVIKRNERVEVEPEYIEILKDSVIETVIRDFDAAGNKTEKTVTVPRFPFTLA